MSKKPDPRLSRALDVIRRLEWTAGTDAKPCCPICHRQKIIGHREDCPIYDVLRTIP